MTIFIFMSSPNFRTITKFLSLYVVVCMTTSVASIDCMHFYKIYKFY